MKKSSGTVPENVCYGILCFIQEKHVLLVRRQWLKIIECPIRYLFAATLAEAECIGIECGAWIIMTLPHADQLFDGFHGCIPVFQNESQTDGPFLQEQPHLFGC